MDSPLCTFLAWDTEFFGRRIYRVRNTHLNRETVETIMSECKTQEAECLYFLADANETESFHLAEEIGFRLVDIRITLTKNGNELSACGNHSLIRSAQPEDIPALQSIASEAHVNTRFYADPRLAPKAPLLYREWITKSVNGDADLVFVAELDRKPVGYITGVQKFEGEGQIGLVGVSSTAQKGGIGQALMVQAMEWFAEREIRQVHVVTQGSNLAAQRLYQKCGFRTSNTQLWFHWWSSQE